MIDKKLYYGWDFKHHIEKYFNINEYLHDNLLGLLNIRFELPEIVNNYFRYRNFENTEIYTTRIYFSYYQLTQSKLEFDRFLDQEFFDKFSLLL